MKSYTKKNESGGRPAIEFMNEGTPSWKRSGGGHKLTQVHVDGPAAITIVQNEYCKQTDRIRTTIHSLDLEQTRHLRDFLNEQVEIMERGAAFRAIADLVKLAEACEPSSGNYYMSVEDLSNALRQAGYKSLAKAVKAGTAWPQYVAGCRTVEQLKRYEDDAAEPGWSWNRHPETTA